MINLVRALPERQVAGGLPATLLSRNAKTRYRGSPKEVARSPRPRTWSWLVAAGSALTVFVLTLPAAVEPTGAGLDESWRIGLVFGARAQRQWGSQVLFTYGPLGYLDDTRFIFFEQWVASLATNIAVHVVFVGALGLLLVGCRARPGWWLLLAAFFLLPLPALPSVEHECVLATFAFMVVAATALGERMRISAAAAAGVLIAFLALVKGTSLLSGMALLALFALFAVRPGLRRPASAALAAAATAFVLLWLVAGQQLAGLPAYLRGIVEIISGYAPAMGLDGNVLYPPRNLQAQLWAVGVGLTLVGGQLAYAAARRKWSSARVILLALPVLFVDFKEGFVRFGVNHTTFYAMVVLVEVLVIVAIAAERRRPPIHGTYAASGTVAVLPLLLPAFAIAAAAAAALSIPAVTALITVVPPASPLASLGQRVASYGDAARILASPVERQHQSARNVAGMQNAFRLSPRLVEEARAYTTDIYPSDIGIAYAYGLRYLPRPVLQSYSGYTAYLDHLDAAAWSRPDGPDRMLVSYQAVDGRYAVFDEPAAFRAMLENYAVVDAQGSQVLLARRPPRAYTDTPIARETSALFQLNEVPSVRDGSLYAYVDMHLSTIGRLLSLAYKPPPAAVTLDYGSGKHSFYHFVPAVAADGLFFSSFIEKLSDLADVIQRRPGTPITSFTITVDQPVRAYYTGLTIEYRQRHR